MHTNVVYFRVMRRLCRREWSWLWNWRCVNQHSWDPWQRTCDHSVWRLTLTAYWRLTQYRILMNTWNSTPPPPPIWKESSIDVWFFYSLEWVPSRRLVACCLRPLGPLLQPAWRRNKSCKHIDLQIEKKRKDFFHSELCLGPCCIKVTFKIGIIM